MRISDWSSDVCSSDLRKRQEPFAVAVSADTLDTVERRVYRSAYKGITDLITKYLWPEPAMHATRLCVRLGITPNMVTSASAALMLAALWLFWHGDHGWGRLAGGEIGRAAGRERGCP